MARITVNTSGTQPTLLVSTDIIPAANANTWGNIANTLSVTCLQDITITNSTGVYSYTDFCNTDMNKLTTPADNEISVNMVIDSNVFFGVGGTGSAANLGISELSISKIPLQFKLVMNGGNSTANAYYYAGQGFISQLAPTASPDAPVWITPMTLAVDGSMVTDKNP
jgi:hypothetical protein